MTSISSDSELSSGKTPGPSPSPVVKQQQNSLHNKKPYYNKNKPRFNQPATKTAYVAKSLPATLSTRVIRYYHPIQTNTSGIDNFSRLIYQTYASRDKRLETAFSANVLSYVSTLALTYKIYRLSNRLCYGMMKPSFYNDLEDLATALTLPESIAKYIECVGKVPISSGICLVPYAPSEQELEQHSGYLHLGNLVEDEPNITRASAAASGKIFLSSTLVGNYMMGAAIGAKFGTLFRKVDWSMEDGTPPFISAYSESDAGKLIGYSPMEIEQVQCQLGACYRFRAKGKRSRWLGYNADYRLVQETCAFFETIFIVEKVLNHLMAR